jgi:peptide/nickel transport system substrate-binding protein
MIDHVDVVDDYTVRIYTQGTQPDLPWYTCDLSPAAGTGVVFPKSYIERYGMEYFQSHPIGSGPWKFVNHVLGDMVEYEALDKHWRQAPEFKKLTVILMPEETTRVASLKTGAVDSIDISLESVSELEAAGCRTSSLASYSLAVMLHGAYQQGAGPIGDVRVRQALSLAINRDEIRKSFFYGKAGPPGPPFLSEESRDFDVTYWMDYAAKAFRYDPEEAKRLLTEAGYPNGISIELWSYPIRGATYLPKLAEIVQSYWLKVGVKAQIVPTDDGAFKKIRNTLTSPRLIGQASMNKWGCTTPTPRWLTTGYHPTAGAVALVGNAMPDLTKLIEQSSSEMNPTKRKELIEKAIQITFDSWTDLQIARAPSLIALGPRVDINLPPTAQSVNLFANVAKHRK